MGRIYTACGTDSQAVGTHKAVQTGATALISLKALVHTIMEECVALEPPLPFRARVAKPEGAQCNRRRHRRRRAAATTPAELLPHGWPDSGGKSHRNYNYKGARGERMIGPDPMLFDDVHRAPRSWRRRRRAPLRRSQLLLNCSFHCCH